MEKRQYQQEEEKENLNQNKIIIPASETISIASIGCDKCDGYGNIVTENGVIPCSCKLKAVAEANLKSAQIPPMYAHKSFENFKTNTPARKRHCELAKRFVEKYQLGDRGLMFMGGCGTGKTHLAVAILKGLILRGYTGLFYGVIALLDDLRASYSSSEEGEDQWRILDSIYNVDILVLDDLGAEKTSGWVNDRLYAIINHRYEHQKTTIITTNQSKKELEEQVGYRILSRLYEMCDVIAFEGKDYRLETMKPR